MYPTAVKRRRISRQLERSLKENNNDNNSHGSLGKLHKTLTSIRSGGIIVKKHAKKGLDRVQRLQSKKYTWKDLNKIEKKRREILGRRNISFVGTLLFWNGTVLSNLTKDPFFYFLLLLYISIRVVARFRIPQFVASVATANIGIIGGFLSFFLALYVNSANDRFTAMYRNSRNCQGGIMDAAALARTTLPRERALRLIRYLNAAHVAGYIGLSSTYTFDNFFVPANKAKRMLTKSEVRRMEAIGMDNGGSACKEMVVWAMAEVTTAHKAKLMDSRLAHCYRELIFKLRGNFAALYDYADQPIGFFYVHFVCLLSAIYLPLFTVQVALQAGVGDELYWVNDILSGLLVLLQAVYILGLRQIADRLSDPYGDDLEDLSILEYVDEVWVGSRRMLEAELPPEPTLREEDYLAERATQSIGYPWEADEVDTDDDVSLTASDLEEGAFGGGPESVTDLLISLGEDSSTEDACSSDDIAAAAAAATQETEAFIIDDIEKQGQQQQPANANVKPLLNGEMTSSGSRIRSGLSALCESVGLSSEVAASSVECRLQKDGDVMVS